MKRISLLILLSIALSACQAPKVGPADRPAPTLTTAPAATAPIAPTATAGLTAAPAGDLYLDSAQPPEKRAEDLLSRMTLEEKIGQMTQVDRNGLTPRM